jgi:hypothetical protein
MTRKVRQSELDSYILREFDSAYALAQSQRFPVYAQAWGAYWRQNNGSEQDQKDIDQEDFAKAGLQSGDIADQIEALAAEVGPSLGKETRVIFAPTDGQDIKASAVESEIVGRQVFYSREGRSGWLDLMATLRDGALLGLSVMKVWVDKGEKIEREELEGLTPEELDAAQAPRGPRESVRVLDVEALEPDPEAMSPGPLFNAELERTVRTQRMELLPIAPESFLYSDDAGRAGIGQCRFAGELIRIRKGQLRTKEKIPEAVVTKLQAATSYRPEQLPRRRASGQQEEPGRDNAQEVDCCWCYVIAPDKDGEQQWRSLLAVRDRQVLKVDKARYRPYAVGTLIQASHEVAGGSIYDKLADVQICKTQLLKQLMDNAENNLYPGLGVVDGEVNLQDAQKRGPRWVLRMNRPESVFPVPVQDMGPSIIASMQYLDRVRTARAGAALDMQGPELTIQGDTAHGIERQFQPRELMTALMLRTWSETLLASVYLLSHSCLREGWEGPLMVQVSNEWQQVMPSTWAPRDSVAVSVDQGVGARAQEAGALAQVITQQGVIYQGGGGDVLVNAATMYDAMIDWGRASGVADPGRYLIDPRSPQAQKALQDKADAAAKQAAAQGAIVQAVAEMQAGVEAWKVEMDNAFKYYDAALKAWIEEAKILGQATAALEAAALGAAQRSADIDGTAERVDPNRPGGLDAADGARTAGDAAGDLPTGGGLEALTQVGLLGGKGNGAGKAF